MSVYYVETAIRHQGFGYAYALWRLVVFEQGCHYTRQCQCRTVQCVTQFGFLVGIAIAAFQTIGLVCVEIRYRTYFEPTFLRLGIYLEVETECRSETHIAATQTQYAIGKFELLQQALDMGQHLFVRLLAMLGGVDAHNFHFGKFVQTVQAAYILAI